MKIDMTIKIKLIGSFIISFIILAIVFMSFIMPHFREKMIEDFKNNAINNIMTIDDKANYVLKAELENLTFEDISQKNDDEIMDILHSHLIFSKNDIYKLELGSFNILVNDIKINIDELGNIEIDKLAKEMKRERIIEIINSGGIETVSLDNIDYHIIAAKGYNRKIIYYRMINCDELLSYDYQKIEYIVNIGIIFILVFSGFLLFFIHRIIILPIRKLNEVTTKIVETGNMDIQVEISCSDEIGTTADSFNAMVKKIKNNQENLEKIVDERTKKLKDAKKEAVKASKAKSDFLANMSHEIRTPINAVLGLNDLLLRTKLDFKQKDYASKISKAANNLLNIINDILDFSKVEAGKMLVEKVEFQLDDIIDEIAGIVGIKAADQGIEFVIKVDNNVPRVLIGDPKRLIQVLLNFINNAVKFTHEGEVLLEVILIDEEKDRVKLRFKIKDTGIGMNEEAINSLFDKFTQADSTTTRVYGGTGLGMAISKKIIDLMEGKINVESQLNKGTTFKFEIELEKGKQSKVQLFDGAKKIDADSVLIIDDNEDQLLTFMEYLKPFFNKIYTVKSGTEAIEALKINNYDLMIVDYKMDPINGFETIEHIIESDEIEKPKKIILTTAYGREIVDENFSEYKIDDVLMKPVQQNTLLKSIKSVFNKEKVIERIENVDDIVKKCNGRILVAEDNEINQMVVVENLENSGFKVDIAADGKEAIDKALNNQYDIILMDLQMPIYSGYEASVKINEKKQSEIPIVALSADVFPGVEEKVKNAGMVGYISKPIEFEKLFKIIFKYIKCDSKIASQENEITKKYLIKTLPSFDVEKGLNRMNDNINSYTKVLKRFRETSCKLMKDIKVSVKKDENNNILNILHQFKGASGNLGLNKGYNLTKDIENKIKNNENLDKTKLDELYNVIEEASLEIDNLDIVKKNTKITGDTAYFKKNLIKLKEKVINYDVEAIEDVLEIESGFKEQEIHFEYDKLLNAVNDYRYEDALDVIEKILNKLS